MKTIIEEQIYSIETKQPIRRAVFEYKDSRITRELFILDSTRNGKIDVIDHFWVSLKEIESKTPNELGTFLKKELEECFDRNIKNEIPFFDCPIIINH